MKQIIYLALGFVLTCFISCNQEEKEAGMGILQLAIGINNETIDIETKAESKSDSCKVQIKNRNGDIIRKYNATTMPAEEWLLAGSYVVEATLGTPKKTEFDHPCYMGKEEVYIEANRSISKEIVCKLIQSKVTVIYETGITANFKDYSASVEMGTSKLEFKKDSTKIGYYYNGTEEEQSLICKVTATPNGGGSVVTKEIKIEKIQPCMHYAIHIDYNTEIAEGGFKFKIEVNEAMKEENDDVTLPITKYPVIDCAKNIIFGQIVGATDFIALKVKGYPALSQLVLSGNFLEALSLPTSIDLFNLEQSAIVELKNKGFDLGEFETDPNDKFKHQQRIIKIPVPLTNLISKELNIKVVDSKGQSRELNNIQIVVTDLNVVTMDIPFVETWATHTTLYGKLKEVDSEATGVSFQYRKEGEEIWQSVSGVIPVKDGVYSTLLSSLTPGTTYEYRITETKNGQLKFAGAKTFTTEAVFPLPNYSFDEWNGNNPWPADGVKFWDTGNKAANSAGLVLTQSSDLLPSGITRGKSAYLKSQYAKFIVDIFAAGNIFAGNFGKIVGTGAEMTFGQPCTSRPTKLTGYYKYKSKVIDWDKRGGLIGKNDRFQIYIMLTDGTHYLNTNNQSTFFDYDKIKRGEDEHVIAFGELTNELIVDGVDKTPEINMDKFEKFNIPITYYKSNQKPTHIIIAGTSSKYGDYYTGGIGSELWLDEFNLIYDDDIIIYNK